MIDFSKEQQEIKAIIVKFENELKKMRIGRASIAAVEDISTEIYGALTLIRHAASISSPDPKSVVIKPWDKNNLPAIERALLKTSLGLGIIAEKDQVRVIFPPLTEERRVELAKVVNKEAEETRISLRKRRDKIWKTIQEEENAKLISEDQKFSQKEQMEKMVAEANKKIVEIASAKEKELLTI